MKGVGDREGFWMCETGRHYRLGIYRRPLCEGSVDQSNVVAQANNLQMIVRAHECVMDGFERFAQGHLITLFSATNYCGTANNAGDSLQAGPVHRQDGAELVASASMTHGLYSMPGDAGCTTHSQAQTGLKPLLVSLCVSFKTRRPKHAVCML